MRWLAFLGLLCVFGTLAAADVKSVRAWQEADRTQVVFDLTEQLEYRVFTMANPDRVVVDFNGARARGPLALTRSPSGRIRALRSAPRGADGLRVVIDLNVPVLVKSVTLAPDPAYGDRVALELSPRLGATTSRPRQPPPRTVAVPRQPAASPLRTVALTPPAALAAAPTRKLRDLVIAIDAGHGGDDVGAIGARGTYEKDIVLAVARELAALVNREPGMRAVLTRDGDYFLKLRERMDKARARKADLFISIHADAFRDRRVQGSSVFVLSQSGASSEAAKWLADNENASDLIGGVSLDDKDQVLKSVLLDLSQTASIEASIDLGNHVLGAMKRLGAVHRKRIEHAGFMVLKSPDIPSILVETAFISNPTEEKKLRNAAYRRQLAGAIFRGVNSYFDISAPPDTRLADNRSHRVSNGETLSGIANRYDVSIGAIKLANNLRTEMVRTGEVLQIP